MYRNYFEPKNILKINRIYTIFERECFNSFSFSGESHDFWEFVYVAKGSIRVSADDRVYILSEDDIIFHKPLELHKFSVECKSGAVIYVVSYLPEGEIAKKWRIRFLALTPNKN